MKRLGIELLRKGLDLIGIQRVCRGLEGVADPEVVEVQVFVAHGVSSVCRVTRQQKPKTEGEEPQRLFSMRSRIAPAERLFRPPQNRIRLRALFEVPAAF
jgi:hypothetical protein